MVNGEVVSSSQFTISNSEITQAGYQSMGSATFSLPASGNVQLSITGSYTIQTGADVLVPIPLSIPPNYNMGTINIPTYNPSAD